MLVILFQRYQKKINDNKEVIEKLNLPEKCSFQNLHSLSNEAINNASKYPNDKLHRWLGFTQGVLSTIGIIEVDEEREFTRTYLHSYHHIKPNSFGN